MTNLWNNRSLGFGLALTGLCLVLAPRPLSAQEAETPPAIDSSDVAGEAETSTTVSTAASSGESGQEAGAGSAEAPEATAEENAEQAPSQENPAFEEARSRFVQGTALARAGNCEGALAEFRASFELMPRTSTLYNMASCEEELHRYDRAVETYERYLEMAGPDEPDRVAVESTLRILRNLLGTLIIESNVAAEVWLGDRIVGQAPGEVLVPGGRHVLELRAEGYLPERREVEVTARERTTLEVTLTEPADEVVNIQNIEQRAPLSPAIFYSGLGLTALSAGIGAYFGVDALLLADAANQEDPRLPPDLSPIEQSALIADIFYLGAGVFAAATTVLFFLTDFGDPNPDTDDAAAGLRWRVLPQLSPNAAAISLEVQL